MDSTALEVTLVRHGATAWNENGRWQGRTDNPLGPLGQQQAHELAEKLRGQKFALVYASDLSRAAQTAALALPAAPLRLDTRLREYDFGDYEGLTVPEMQARPDYARWQADPWNHPVPGGESLAQVAARMQDWLAELPATGQVIAFSHSIAIRTLLVALFGTPLQAQPNYPIPYPERIGNGQPVTIRREGGVWQRDLSE